MRISDWRSDVCSSDLFIILKLLEKRGGGAQVRDEVHVRHILIKPSEIRSEAETQRLAQKLYERIAAGEDFAELAKSLSEDHIGRAQLRERVGQCVSITVVAV